MKNYDYSWNVNKNSIVFDNKLNIDKLGWKHGDLFKITNKNGQAMLVKIDPLEKFVRSKDHE